MLNLRLNQAVKWHKREGDLVIFLSNKKITLPYDQSLFDLFVDLLEKYPFLSQNEILSKYQVSKKILMLLEKLNILISIKNYAGLEALFFHKLTENPATTTFPEQYEELFITSLYENLENYFYVSLGEKINYKSIYKPLLETSYIRIIPTRSARKNLNRKETTKKDEILKMIHAIFNNYKDGHLYGSGGGLYSVYPILVFNDDSTFIYDRYKGIFYTDTNKGIYKEIAKSFISSSFNIFESYECYVVLVSVYQATISKYGNRGYKYIQMEAGSIATLLRQYSANLGIPQLEVQGYFDQDLSMSLEKHFGIKKTDTLLVHIVCLN